MRTGRGRTARRGKGGIKAFLLHRLDFHRAQARGIGQALLADAESSGAITLECFRDNSQARDFYEKHGWKLTKSLRRAFCGEDYDFVLYAKGA